MTKKTVEERTELLADELAREISESPSWTKLFPTAVTGDGSPTTWAKVREALYEAVEEWVELNVPVPLADLKEVHQALLELLPGAYHRRVELMHPGEYINLYGGQKVVFGLAHNDDSNAWHVAVKLNAESEQYFVRLDTANDEDPSAVAEAMLDFLGWPVHQDGDKTKMLYGPDGPIITQKFIMAQLTNIMDSTADLWARPE